MRSTYKLKLKYPSLPKNWEIGMEVGQGDRTATFANYSPCSSKYFDNHLSCFEVEDFPEFWEKTKEKEFKILQNSYYSSLFPKIYSIQRLVDGIIFSIGDKVYNPKLMSNQSFVITEFCFDCNKEHLLALGGSGGINITKIDHYKEPIFITEDSYSVYNDLEELLFSVGIKVGQSEKDYFQAISFRNKWLSKPNTDDFRWFKSEKIAKEYIEKNKPQYSLQQILNIIRGFDNEMNEYKDDDNNHYLYYINKYK